MVTGVRDFGAFIDCGVNKDGLLHVSEADARGARLEDMRDHVALGEKVRVKVLSIESDRKFTLTCRPTPGRPRFSTSATVATGAAAERARLSAEAAANALAEAEARAVAARAAAAARAAQAKTEADARAAVARAEAEAAARSAEAVRAAGCAWEALTAAATVGAPVPRPQSEARGPILLATVTCRGRARVLYQMPWKAEVGLA